MKHALVVLGLLAATAAYAEPTPDMRGILSVIGRDGFAHACPIGPSLAITADHVVDPLPFDPNGPLLRLRWFQNHVAASPHGILIPTRTSSAFDLVLMESDDPFAMYYPIATEAPQVGDRLWWLGYDFENRDKAFDRVIFTGRVRHSFAGLLQMDKETVHGTSGSCVLNDRGQVVAIVARRLTTEDSRLSALFEAVWGEWLLHAFPPIKLPQEALQ